MNVRRLAAIDMYGLHGTVRRRRVIVAEFLLGVLALLTFGAWQLASGSGWEVQALGYWALGAGLNYVPLTIHAVRLSRPGALAAELAGVDPRKELGRYGVLQLWIAVPLALLVFEARARAKAGR